MRLTKNGKNTKAKPSTGFVSKVSVGIDIGQDAIRVVQVSGRSLNQVQLDKYSIIQIPKNVIKGTVIHDFDRLVASVQQACSQINLNTRSVISCVPQTLATIDTVVYNEKDAGMDLVDFVEFEISQQLPLDEVNYDYSVLSGNSASKKILIAALRKEEVESRVELFDSSDLSLQFLDVDILAQVNAFNFWISKQSPELWPEKIMIVHISENEMYSFVVQEGSILYKQVSSLGGEQLNQLIQRTYQISEEQAKVMRRSRDKAADYQVQVLDRFNAQVSQEIQRVLQFYYTTQSGDQFSNVKNIFLTGTGASQANLAETIFSQTNTATECVNPVFSLSCANQIDTSELQQDASELTTALGLALRGI